MSDPRPSYGRDGRRRPPRSRGSRPRPGQRPPIYGVKAGTGTLVTCHGPCGLLVEVIEIGTAGPPLDVETFVCGLCAADEIWGSVEPTEPPSAPQEPAQALRVLMDVQHREPSEDASDDLLALLGGPEGRRSAPVSLVPRPVLPEDAQDEDADPVDRGHTAASDWSTNSLW